MYKVLLADDEPSIIESMKENIDWAKYNAEVAYCASNGKEAHEIIVEKEPDIAILDIRMPGYSGLDLSKMIFQNGLKTKVIILSGYAEFSYAQKAIQYNVLGYCLKPVEYEEIIQLIVKAIDTIDEKGALLSQDSFLEAIETNDLDRIKTYMASNDLSTDKFYLAASLSQSPIFTNGVFAFKAGSNLYGYLSNNPFVKDGLKRYITSGEATGIAIYPTSLNAKSLRMSIYNSIAMCYQSFIDPEVTICDEYYDSHSIKIVSDIQNALSFSNKESVLKLLAELKVSPDKKKMSVHSLQQLVNGILTNTTLIKDESDDYIYNYKQLTGLYSSIDECIDNLIEKLSQSNKEPEAGASISNFYFLKIMKYINTYYTNDISLKDVADVVNLNPNYISQMFKKATGTTFTKYLTDLRIKNAQNLLLQTTDSINEISLKTGFNDYFYFLKIFKKYTGKTPSEYRSTAK